MTLQYIEQNVAHWLMQRDVLAFMVPSPEGRTQRPGSKATVGAYARELDGLVLMGGSDVCPETYGEKALQPEWNGDRIRDDYEIALLRAFMARAQAGARRLPRRAGDQRRAWAARCIRTSRRRLPGALNHRNWDDLRRELPRDVVRRRQPASRSSIPTRQLIKTNSIHHQAVKDLGRDSRRRGVVGARSHRRGDPLHGPRLRVRRAVASGVPRAGRSLVRRRHADPRRVPGRRRAAQGRGVRDLTRSSR